MDLQGEWRPGRKEDNKTATTLHRSLPFLITCFLNPFPDFSIKFIRSQLTEQKTSACSLTIKDASILFFKIPFRIFQLNFILLLITVPLETYFRTAAHFWVCFSKAFCALQSHLKFLQLFSGGGGSLYLLFGATG